MSTAGNLKANKLTIQGHGGIGHDLVMQVNTDSFVMSMSNVPLMTVSSDYAGSIGHSATDTVITFEKNIVIDGDLEVTNNVLIDDTLTVAGDTHLNNSLNVVGNAAIVSDLSVVGEVSLSSGLSVANTITVNGITMTQSQWDYLVNTVLAGH